jgi:hypothetical protein
MRFLVGCVTAYVGRLPQQYGGGGGIRMAYSDFSLVTVQKQFGLVINENYDFLKVFHRC